MPHLPNAAKCCGLHYLASSAAQQKPKQFSLPLALIQLCAVNLY